MPPGKRKKEGKGAARSDVYSDPFFALPDALLHHILSFLPAQEAVRTCLVARRWRHLWKSATGLRLICDGMGPEAVQKFQLFVDHLLLFRGRVTVEKFDLRFRNFSDVMDELRVSFWIRHVILCEVRMLRLENINNDGFELDKLPLVSRHLTRLEIVRVDINNSFCNFSNCPFLEHLHISHCYLTGSMKISSESLKHLNIRVCRFSNFTLNVPSLVSLWLNGDLFCMPVLNSMPSLQEAFIRDVDDEDCDLEHYQPLPFSGVSRDNKRLFLERLSQAEKLALLISESNVCKFWMDLDKYPIFGKLTTLLLNEGCCVAPDFHALTCILNHSPVLEKLTLQLFSKGPKHKKELIGRYNPLDKSATIPELLKAIHIKCEVINDDVHEVLQFLSTLNIYFLFK